MSGISQEEKSRKEFLSYIHVALAHHVTHWSEKSEEQVKYCIGNIDELICQHDSDVQRKISNRSDQDGDAEEERF